MRTIFAKYNSERLPKYQISTKIVMDNNGKKYACKEPLNDKAKEHVENIYNHYELLKSAYNINLVKPIKIDSGILFEMAEGESLEKILLEAINANDNEAFQSYIDKFLNFVDGMVNKRDIMFEPSKEFVDIFGTLEMEEPQDIIKIANIDLIFGNIFVDSSDNFTLIDYEWVFDFEVPKSYIIWRSLAVFSNFHEINLDNLLLSTKIINYDKFIELEKKFSDFVRGQDKKYFLTERVRKQVNFLNLENKKTSLGGEYFIQLFLDQGDRISEGNSLKLPVVQNANIQEFVFDLSDLQPIHALRLDPLNKSCVIDIEKLKIIYSDCSESDLTSRINANACSHHCKRYFFDSEDPIIFLDGLNAYELREVKKLVIFIRFLHIGIDAVHVCMNHIVSNKNLEIENFNNNIYVKILKKFGLI